MTAGLAEIAAQIDRLHPAVWLLAGILFYVGFISIALRRIATALEALVARLPK